MSVESLQQFVTLQIPQLNGIIRTATDKNLLFWASGKGINEGRMTFEDLQ
jgi:hypothetical protein